MKINMLSSYPGLIPGADLVQIWHCACQCGIAGRLGLDELGKAGPCLRHLKVQHPADGIGRVPGQPQAISGVAPILSR